MKNIVSVSILLLVSACSNSVDFTSAKKYERAISCYKLGEYDQAVELSSQIIEQSENIDVLADAKYLRGFIYKKRDSVDLAYQDIHDARMLYSFDNNQKGQSKSSVVLGNICYQYDSYKNALKFFSESYNLSKVLRDKKLVANSLYGIARTEKRLGNLEVSIRKMYEVLELEADLERDDYYIDCLLELADIHNLAGSHDYALEKNWQAINSSIGTELEDVTRTKAYYNIGDIYLDQKNFAKAEIFLDSSLNLNALSKTDSAIIFNNFGRLHHGFGNDFLAADFFKKSLECNHYKTDMFEVAETKANLELMKKNGLSKDSLFLCYEALVNVSFPDFMIRQRLEKYEFRMRMESIEGEKAIVQLQDKNLVMSWKLWSLIALMGICLIVAAFKLKSRQKKQLEPLHGQTFRYYTLLRKELIEQRKLNDVWMKRIEKERE